mmetsp:Transcript_44708/g.95079  ORF Transcript_44708/g.95079 Transcript_44708/m.95079 type:complete len:201 (+) Transcript_44708:350-952(+)
MNSPSGTVTESRLAGARRCLSWPGAKDEAMLHHTAGLALIGQGQTWTRGIVHGMWGVGRGMCGVGRGMWGMGRGARGAGRAGRRVGCREYGEYVACGKAGGGAFVGVGMGWGGERPARRQSSAAEEGRDVHAELVLRDDGAGRARLPVVKPVPERHLGDHERGKHHEQAQRHKFDAADRIDHWRFLSLRAGFKRFELEKR